MSQQKEQFKSEEMRLLRAQWEGGLVKMITPFERFVNHQAASGLILITMAIAALIVANSSFFDHYQHLLHTEVGLQFGAWHLEKSLHHWINDGLMALFFFVVGLELKREMLVGELSSPRLAALPITAAIGGMVVPALIYTFINLGTEGVRGWGIPMATDIAFALGVIALLAGRVPKGLLMFLVAVAIVDDLGAVLVIALFYTEQLIIKYLVIGAGLTALMVAANMAGIRRPAFYFVIGLMLWFVLLKSGVHATLAGVITAFTIPALPRFDPKSFSERVRELLKKFDESYKPGDSILKNQEMSAVVQTIESGVKGVETPLQRLEHKMHTPVAFIILPIFAFFNAGVAIDFGSFSKIIVEPVTLGVICGLLLGKCIGVIGFSYLAVKMNLASLPKGVNMKHIIGAALLASIGFTMSIFIAELAFAGQPMLLLEAKLGILTASFVAGIAGYTWLYCLGEKKTPQAQIAESIT